MFGRVVNAVVFGGLALGVSFLSGAIFTFFALQPQTRIEVTYDKAITEGIVEGFNVIGKDHAITESFCTIGMFNKNASESWIALGELVKQGWITSFVTKDDTLAINACKFSSETPANEAPHRLDTQPL